MSGRLTARHEMRHCLAAGVALVELNVSRAEYDTVGVHISIKGDDGEFALEPGTLPAATLAQASAAAAIGPVA